MFHRLLFRAIAPFTAPSALQAPILDRGADSGGGAGYRPWDAKVHGGLCDFCHCVPYFLECCEFRRGNAKRTESPRKEAARRMVFLTVLPNRRNN